MKSLFLVIALLAPSLSFADNWCNVPLQSTDGTVINLDFQMNYDGGFYVDPLWVNVAGNIQPTDTITAFLQQRDGDNQGLQIKSVALTYDKNSKKFTGNLDTGGISVAAPDAQGRPYAHQENFWIQKNGVILTDPVSQNRSFVVDLYSVHTKNPCFKQN